MAKYIILTYNNIRQDKMDVLISKVEEIQNDLIKMRKSLKILTKRQKMNDIKSFAIEKSEFEVCNLQPKNLIMTFLPL